MRVSCPDVLFRFEDVVLMVNTQWDSSLATFSPIYWTLAFVHWDLATYIETKALRYQLKAFNLTSSTYQNNLKVIMQSYILNLKVV